MNKTEKQNLFSHRERRDVSLSALRTQHVILDTETYPNYFCIVLKILPTEETISFEIRGENESMPKADRTKLNKIMKEYTTFGFNNSGYDNPIIRAVITNAKCKRLYKISKTIIDSSKNATPPWELLRKLGRWCEVPEYWRFGDLQRITPVINISLKALGCRLEHKTLSELPYDPTKPLTHDQMDMLLKYCHHDVAVTERLYEEVKDSVDMRIIMGEKHGRSFLSKTDPQVAEDLIRHGVSGARHLKGNTKKPEGRSVSYTAPDFIKFRSDDLNKLLAIMNTAKFNLKKTGEPICPKELGNGKITIGNTTYTVGIGGLHSNESAQSVIPKEYETLLEADVTSFYPNIILKCGIFPQQVGEGFLKYYQTLVDDRVKAKRSGDDLMNNFLKLGINASFGKMGSVYSFLYSPKAMLGVTITGQLSLLMLIETLEDAGISVVSSNTDAVVCLVHDSNMSTYEVICNEWMANTGFNLEYNEYLALYSEHVNSYLALKADGGNKTKGSLSLGSIRKTPSANIIPEAVAAFLEDGISIEDTIRKCNDIGKFVCMRQVKANNGTWEGSGAEWRGEKLGKNVRYYWSTDGDPITYAHNGNKVPDSAGSVPVQDFPAHLPDDIDYDRYFKKAYMLLAAIGHAETSI